MKRRTTLNRADRIVWNQTSSASVSARKLVVAALALMAPLAHAAPGGGLISAGSGAIAQTGATTTVTQQSRNLAIDWQSFGIAANEAVRFNQPDTASIALNRVFGQDPSQIFGSLAANGQVFILNPNGVLFGSTAQVNVGGLVASTLSLSNADFMAGNNTFTNPLPAGGTGVRVINQGNLTAADGGYIALLAPEVRNEGMIAVTLGTALLAAGGKVTLNLNNGSLLSYSVDQGSFNALAENKHLIQADGGQVILTARAVDALARAVVNNTGIIEARTVQNIGGTILLVGDEVRVSGTLDASGRDIGETGGTVKVLGDRVGLFDGANIGASGDAGGGTVLIGGNFQGKGPEQNATATFVAQNARINADALTSGDGGKVVLWSDGATRAFGSISARGGAQGGNGGFVEVSGKQSLGFAAAVDTGAPNGRTGLLLLDPVYAIISGNPDGTVGDTETINASSLVTNLNNNDITVQAGNKVTVDAAVNASGNANAHNLALDAPTVDLNAAITLKSGGVLSGTAGTVNVNGASIQNGVDVAASGATVNVAAGTYTLATRLNVNKPLTLRGAQHGVDPRIAAALRTAGSGAETIVDGNNLLPILLRIGGSNVTVDGFEFRNGTGDLIDSNVPISAPLIRYNLIHNSSGDEGVQIRNSTGAILEYNRVYNTGPGDGLNFDNSTSGTIRYNEVHDNSSVNAAIYVYGSTNTTIQGNYVHDVHLKEGIKLGDSGGADVIRSGGSIIDNVVDNTFSDGITVYTSDVTVSGNQVSNSLSQDGAIFVYYNVNNVAINNNTISDSGVSTDAGVTYAIRVGSGTRHPTNVTVAGNTFLNNEAQFFDNNGAGQIATIFAGNTFDRSAMASGDNRIWSNVQDGINVAASGGTVTVGAGIYPEAVNISTNNVTMKLAGNTTINSLATSAASSFVDLQNFTLGLSGTIEGPGALDLLGGGSVTLGGTVGSGAALASFSGAAGTALTVNGGLVRTSGAQIYNGATTFGGATTLRTTAGGNISAPGIVTATAGTFTLDTGTGDATFTNIGNDFSTVAATSGNNVSLVDANTLSVAGINATGLVDVRTQTGDLTLNNAIATTSTSANAVTLVADAAATPNATGSGGNFKNAGAAAITTGAGGAWRVYTGNPTGITRGGLTEAGKRYNVDDGSDPLASGNRIYFRIRPTLTLAADNKTKVYGDANPTFTYSSSGLIDSDLIGAAISSGPGYTVDGSTSTAGQLTAGTHNITPGAAIATSLGYSLGYANGALTVGQKALTITAAGVAKVYDGSTAATVNFADNRLAGDVLTVAGSAAFADKNVGTGKAVNVTGITLSNTDAGNYAFNTTAATAADITARALAVTATGVNKVYDGLVAATVIYGDNRVAGDVLSIAGSAAFADKNVGTGKTVNVTGITLSNTDAGNYAFNTTAATTADITAKALSLSGLTADNKVYDGTIKASISSYGSLNGIVSGETVTLDSGGASSAFADKNVGTGKTVNVTGIGVTGSDAGNYIFNTAVATTADITARALTVAANDATKTYTGAAYSGGNGVTYTGFANGEISAVLGGTLVYGGTSQGAINAGSYLITPGGLNSGNYIITYTDGVLTVNPAPAAGGMPPAVAEAIVALPGGDNLLSAFNAARVVAIAPVNPVVASSGMMLNLQSSTGQSGSEAATDKGGRVAAQPRIAGASVKNNDIVERLGNLTLVNGGIKLPSNAKSSDIE